MPARHAIRCSDSSAALIQRLSDPLVRVANLFRQLFAGRGDVVTGIGSRIPYPLETWEAGNTADTKRKASVSKKADNEIEAFKSTPVVLNLKKPPLPFLKQASSIKLICGIKSAMLSTQKVQSKSPKQQPKPSTPPRQNPLQVFGSPSSLQKHTRNRFFVRSNLNWNSKATDQVKTLTSEVVKIKRKSYGCKPTNLEEEINIIKDQLEAQLQKQREREQMT